MYKIKKANKKDLDTIYKLEKILFEKKSWSSEMLKGEFENIFSKIWILEKEGEIVGYLIFREILDEAEIMKIGIKPEYQKQGLGTLFLNFF